jgi:protein-L-isoaspartate(D-aspartate) O-methyltransferase
MRWPRLTRRRQDRSAPSGPPDPSRDRARMVAEQLEARGIDDPDILDAFRAVPRHAFVDGDEPYGDHAMPVGSGQTISQPYIVARMTQLGRPRGGWRGAPTLEVGTGSGYQAAILAELAAEVTSIERHESLASDAQRRLEAAGYPTVNVVIGDGTAGWPAGAPYRSILVTAGGPSVPQPLLEQLHPDGGRLVMPVGGRQHQLLTLVERTGDDLRSSELEPVVFVPLIGHYGLRAD